MMILRALGRRLAPPTYHHASSSLRVSRPLHLCSPLRTFAAKTIADEKVDEIQELYATARDEFEIASEETDKKTVYAEDDRAAAAEELTKLKTAYAEAIQGEGGEEVKRRVGGRLRELESGVEAMEERAREE